jgi:hypothetical protein
MNGIPWEVRPVEDPVEAKRLALMSMNAARQTRPPARTGRTKPRPPARRSQTAAKPAKWTPPTRGAERYWLAELRWQEHLRRKASMPADGRRSGRDELQVVQAKARRAKLGNAPTRSCPRCFGTGCLPGDGPCSDCAGTGRVPVQKGAVGKVLPGGPEGSTGSTGGGTVV